MQRVEHTTMKTNNVIANYIASKGVTKWMPKGEAAAIWKALKHEGWRAEGLTLVKLHETTEHHFTFEPHGTRVAVGHRSMEVAL